MKCLLVLALAVACLNGITSLTVDSDVLFKPKLRRTRSDKQVAEAVKTVVKRNAEDTNTTAPTLEVSSSPSTAQTTQNTATISAEDLAAIAGRINNNGTSNAYTNVLTVLSGGGLVSVAKAIQTVYVSMTSKKKKKRGKKQDSEEGSDSEDDGPTHTVAVKIEMNNPSQSQITPSKTNVAVLKDNATS